MEQLKFTFDQLKYAHTKYLEKCYFDMEQIHQPNTTMPNDDKPLNLLDWFLKCVGEDPNFIEEYIIPNLEGYGTV